MADSAAELVEKTIREVQRGGRRFLRTVYCNECLQEQDKTHNGLCMTCEKRILEYRRKGDHTWQSQASQ